MYDLQTIIEMNKQREPTAPEKLITLDVILDKLKDIWAKADPRDKQSLLDSIKELEAQKLDLLTTLVK